jgi:hypothetical protein
VAALLVRPHQLPALETGRAGLGREQAVPHRPHLVLAEAGPVEDALADDVVELGVAEVALARHPDGVDQLADPISPRRSRSVK